jgi:hypothetical protein
MLFLCHHYLFAFRAGEPRRVALALAGQAAYQATKGKSRRARTVALLRLAGEIAQRVSDPYARAMQLTSGGYAALLQGQWKKCWKQIKRAERILRGKCVGVSFELGAGYQYRFLALQHLGQWKRCALEIPPLLREARERGDRFTTTFLLLYSVTIHLAADEPVLARQALAEAMTQWPWQGFHLQHYHALLVEAETALYAGEEEQGWQLIHGRWTELQRSQLLRIQNIRLIMLNLRARCALAVASRRGGRTSGNPSVPPLLRMARRDARAIELERMPWSDPGAKLIRAALASLGGQTGCAIRLLEQAEGEFRAADMELHGAVARRLRGRLRGGDQGLELERAADEILEAQGIRNPGRVANMFAPGFAG